MNTILKQFFSFDIKLSTKRQQGTLCLNFLNYDQYMLHCIFLSVEQYKRIYIMICSVAEGSSGQVNIYSLYVM